MGEDGARSTLLAFNTVERLLRGDYFHSIGLADLTGSLEGYPPDWPVCGIGTTNWYRRNGEVILDGTAGSPAVWWADPDGVPRARIVDLLREAPEGADLTSPSLAESGATPRLPFVAIGVCDPASVMSVDVGSSLDVHSAVVDACADRNVGLAAVRASALLDTVDYQTVCHLPLGGADSLDGAEAIRGTAQKQSWVLTGVYAAHPTLQSVASVVGAALHLHGYCESSLIGGHVRTARTVEACTVDVFPLQDLVLRIHDLDSAMLPVRPLA